jgi:glycine/D-amino acid oxidase-like deaminating enzyme
MSQPIIVIGAGVPGCSIAFRLAQWGHAVTVG